MGGQTDPLEAARPLSLLLIDDDTELCGMMREFFSGAGYSLDFEYNGRSGLTRAMDEPYDLVILDVMLPVINGFAVLQQLRRHKDVPVIMLTARGDPQDRITGLDSGADDYLPKPFEPDELLARVRAVVRRLRSQRPDAGRVRTFGDLQINGLTREVSRAGRKIQLTALEFDIFDLLICAGGRILTREEIMGALFEREATPFDRSLDVHISHLRKKLECGRTLIHTIRGVGYALAAQDRD